MTTIKVDLNTLQRCFVEKQKERFEKVILEYNDFVDRYSDSPLMIEAKKIKKQTDQYLNNIK